MAAIHLEDQVFPKTCGSFAGKQVIPLEEHVQKIRAALDARPDPDFVIIARCDAYAVSGWEDTVQRCRAYREAGADLVFVDGMKTLDDLQREATDLADLPRMRNGDLAPTPEVAALGYRLMICGRTMWLIDKQLREAFEEWQHPGRVNPERYGMRWDVAGLLGLDHVYELEWQYGVVETPSAERRTTPTSSFAVLPRERRAPRCLRCVRGYDGREALVCTAGSVLPPVDA